MAALLPDAPGSSSAMRSTLSTKGSFGLFSLQNFIGSNLSGRAFNNRGVVFPNPGRRWKKTRTAALDVLAPKNVDRFSDILDYEADSIIETLLEDSAANAGLYPVKYFQAAAMNVVLTTILGKRATSMKDPLFLEVVTAVDKGMKFAGVANDVSSFLPILSIMDFLVRKERNMRNFIKNERDPLYKRLIKEALESDKDCLLKSLYKLKEEYELDDTGILITISKRDKVNTAMHKLINRSSAIDDLIAAGADTIGVTLSWIVSILCHHPEVQAKMREEVDAFISAHKRLPTFAERENFPYFISVQKECMRYRPTTPFGLLHEATEDCKRHIAHFSWIESSTNCKLFSFYFIVVVRGYYIPKGTTLVSNMQGMHLNPDVYPEPGKFIPERFMNNIRTMSAAANSRIENRDHYNFGWGRRICPGIHLVRLVELWLSNSWLY